VNLPISTSVLLHKNLNQAVVLHQGLDIGLDNSPVKIALHVIRVEVEPVCRLYQDAD
jgi:hypothetical protein